MKHAFVSFIALALIFAGGLTESRANGTASTPTFTVTLLDFPDVVDRGGSVTGSLTVTMVAATPIKRPQFTYQIFISTPLGDAPVKTGTFTIRNGLERTLKVSIPVGENAAPGLYTLKVVLTSGGETASVGHELTVR